MPAPIVLAAVDFEACSETAVLTAADLARAHNARLVLLHVIQPVAGLPWNTPIAPGPGQPAIELRDHLETRARKGLASLAGLARDVRVQPDVRVGHPVEAILAVAEELDTGWIVLGTHGRKGLRRWILGSVAEAVVRRAEVPVITVRHSDTRKQVEEEQGHLSL